MCAVQLVKGMCQSNPAHELGRLQRAAEFASSDHPMMGTGESTIEDMCIVSTCNFVSNLKKTSLHAP